MLFHTVVYPKFPPDQKAETEKSSHAQEDTRESNPRSKHGTSFEDV